MLLSRSTKIIYHETKRMKKMLAREESVNTAVFSNIRRALVPLLDKDISIMLKNVVQKREQKLPIDTKREEWPEIILSEFDSDTLRTHLLKNN